MPKLIEPLEQLAKSDIRLLRIKTDIKNLKVGKGKIGPTLQGYHVGPDQCALNFSYTPGKTLGGFKLDEMMTFSDLGFVLISLSNGDTYAIHSSCESLPKDISFQAVSTREYLARERELCEE